MIPLGPWEPDRSPRLNDEILSVADGAFPSLDGWRPAGQLVTSQTALPSACKGAASFTSPQGLGVIVAGTATGLYKAFSGGWQQIGSGYSLLDDNRWRFAQFGGLAIATNGTDPMVKIDLSTGDVALLGGSPPKFTMLAVVKDFLVGGVRNGQVNTVGWSGINNAEFWTIAQRQADLNILAAGGAVTGLFGGEYGVILQRNRITRLDYVGGNYIFVVNETSSNIGCVSVHTTAQWGNLGFFLSDAGFMMWDGNQAIPIGEEKINRWFFELYGPETWPLMSTAIDSQNKCVFWALPDRVLIYNWVLQRWATLPAVSQIAFSGVTKSVSIDEDYPPDMPLDANIDGVGLTSLDNPIFKGGDPRLFLVGSTGLGSLSGSPMAATFAGSDIEFFTGRRANLRFVRPDIDTVTGVSLSLGGKQRLGDAVASVAASTIVGSGDMPIRFSGRYGRPVWSVAAGTPWTYFRGAEYIGAPGAGR